METKNGKLRREIVSEVLPSGEILELVYQEEHKQTQLVVFDGQNLRYVEKFERPNEVLLPFKADSHLISKKVVLFPSEAKEYGDEKELLQRIRVFIHKYLDISPFFEKIATYYVLFTWGYDQFNELPYLRAIGDYGSGKSRLLQVIGSICYKPMFTGGATTISPIFRIIETFKGTLILDEADYRFSDTTAEITKILNSGYQRGTSVLRSEGKGIFEVKCFSVFCPKIVATRRHFSDPALESRFLVETMDKKELRGNIPINLPKSFEEEALDLRNQLLMWRLNNVQDISLAPEDIDRALEPRLNQIISPLLSVIKDPAVKTELKFFIKEYNDEIIADRGMTIEAEVFDALLKRFGTGDSEPTTQQITDTHNTLLNQKDQLSSRKVGHVLRKQLKLKSRRTGDGFVVPERENKERIVELRRKYGFLEEDVVEEVNDVNVVNVSRDERELIQVEDIL